MQTEIKFNPDFAMVRVQFDAPGEQLVTESGAMVARDTAVQMTTNMRGGLGSALKRKLLGGESLFQNTFTATAPGQTVFVAPAPEGAIEFVDLQPGQELFLQSGAYLCSTPGIQLDTKFQGGKGFFSGEGLFLLRVHGQGRVWFSTYGAIHTVNIGQQYQGYICDTGHMVAFTQGLSYSVNKVGGLKSLFLSGEGLVCTFQGQGRLWMQTRNPGALASFVHPFRRVKVQTN
ncbi:MAG: TIGR00266 family protein [Deltaproteobacteria bacterium]|nr:TIGR00266 family protein [Deltaproteobacteria bacterium]